MVDLVSFKLGFLISPCISHFSYDINDSPVTKASKWEPETT